MSCAVWLLITKKKRRCWPMWINVMYLYHIQYTLFANAFFSPIFAVAQAHLILFLKKFVFVYSVKWMFFARLSDFEASFLIALVKICIANIFHIIEFLHCQSSFRTVENL